MLCVCPLPESGHWVSEQTCKELKEKQRLVSPGHQTETYVTSHPAGSTHAFLHTKTTRWSPHVGPKIKQAACWVTSC